jgi:hypothetical protein
MASGSAMSTVTAIAAGANRCGAGASAITNSGRGSTALIWATANPKESPALAMGRTA